MHPDVTVIQAFLDGIEEELRHLCAMPASPARDHLLQTTHQQLIRVYSDLHDTRSTLTASPAEPSGAPQLSTARAELWALASTDT
ncbi:hypothetical protein [Deinococcus maricopensis]|uniref:Uncharacterized protein n=1 Tax=Deinococcus maricopensis (strain DSM 21211 / LMG 22137 / NRRL B-23946 / LB-34) TaxID=709986 RepID=E8U4C4_DEIML|nr:hypothetical protein [Deinococcus maricopensis]ADV65961.1 hypothetical protein Deima_0300 [Deinococcus maricopensis DSM 21211]